MEWRQNFYDMSDRVMGGYYLQTLTRDKTYCPKDFRFVSLFLVFNSSKIRILFLILDTAQEVCGQV